MKNIKELSLDEIKVLYRDHLKAQGYKRHTIMTSGSEAFYLWQHGNKELFWMTVLSHDFENSAREALLKYLRQDSKGDPLGLVNGYLFHLRKFRNFALECSKSFPLNKQDTAKIRGKQDISNNRTAVSLQKNSEIKKNTIPEEEIQHILSEYSGRIKNEKNNRFLSWEHCYTCFYRARQDKTNADIDYLSLQLAFYLASWGMYRGSTFLLQKDYKIHIPVVEEILKAKYDDLLGITCKDIVIDKNMNALEECIGFLKQYYDKVRRTTKSNDVRNDLSDTLITKTLLGTLGCVPAYDRFFRSGIRHYHIARGIFNRTSLIELSKFYEKNFKILEEVKNDLLIEESISYPQMKIIDMLFWQIGVDLNDTSK